MSGGGTVARLCVAELGFVDHAGLRRLAEGYARAGEMSVAMDAARQALVISDAASRESAAVNLTALGAISNAQGDSEHALLYYRRALLLRTELDGEFDDEVAKCHHNIGIALVNSGQYEETLESFDLALET